MTYQPVGRTTAVPSAQQRNVNTAGYPPNTNPGSGYGVPVPAPVERLMHVNPYSNGGAIGTPVVHHRTLGGAAASTSSAAPTMVINHSTALPLYYKQTARAHGGADPENYTNLDDNPYGQDDVRATEMDDMTQQQHNVLAHVLSGSTHDMLRPTEENMMFSRRVYTLPDHSFFNACMFMTVIAALMAYSTSFVAVVITVCQVAIDLYWYRTVYVVMAFAIGMGLAAITMLHIYRHRSFSKNHVISITMPAIVFVVGSVMCGFGLQWYVSTHGTTIHWHSASQMSALSNILLMNFAWGIAMISITARALGCHWVAEQIDPQTTVELSFTNDEVQASATFRNAARMARVGMGSSGNAAKIGSAT